MTADELDGYIPCCQCGDLFERSELAVAGRDDHGNPTMWWDTCKGCAEIDRIALNIIGTTPPLTE